MSIIKCWIALSGPARHFDGLWMQYCASHNLDRLLRSSLASYEITSTRTSCWRFWSWLLTLRNICSDTLLLQLSATGKDDHSTTAATSGANLHDSAYLTVKRTDDLKYFPTKYSGVSEDGELEPRASSVSSGRSGINEKGDSAKTLIPFETDKSPAKVELQDTATLPPLVEQ